MISRLIKYQVMYVNSLLCGVVPLRCVESLSFHHSLWTCFVIRVFDVLSVSHDFHLLLLRTRPNALCVLWDTGVTPQSIFGQGLELLWESVQDHAPVTADVADQVAPQGCMMLRFN